MIRRLFLVPLFFSFWLCLGGVAYVILDWSAISSSSHASLGVKWRRWLRRRSGCALNLV
jgi:hypothetical protein